jgi:outer membrane autotransporter protein
LGGGVLGRYDFSKTGPGHFYADAYFRAGQSKTDFTSGDILNNAGAAVHFDSSSPYYGAHAGVGYVWNINDRASLDFSARYIWTRLGSDSEDIAGDRFNFDEADSHRIRAGARFSYLGNSYLKPYLGVYYDHDFDGRSRAAVNGLTIPESKLKGGTIMGELGLSVRPSANVPFSIDLGAEVFSGRRDGITGSLRIKFEF